MNNIEIREAIKEAGLKHWQIADIIGVADTTFCRMLRRELPESKRQEILTAIQRAKGSTAAGTYKCCQQRICGR